MSSCVLERALKSGRCNGQDDGVRLEDSWTTEMRIFRRKGGVEINCWAWLLIVRPLAALASLATQAHHMAYQLMNENYKMLAIASFLENLSLFLSDCVPRHDYE